MKENEYIKKLEAEVDRLKVEITNLNNEIAELAFLRQKSQSQAVELELQNEELTSIRYELELQNEELLRSKTEIEQLLKKFNTLFNFVPVGFLLLNNNYEIVEVNNFFVDLLHLNDKSTIINHKVNEILGSQIIDFIKSHNQINYFSEKKVLEIKTIADETKFLRVDIRILENVFETLRHYLLSFVDITEARQYQTALKESEEKFRSIFEQTPVGIYRSTPEGRIILANPKLVKMLGYDTVEEVYAIDLENKDYPLQEGRARFKKIMEEQGEMIGAIETWYRKDGSSIIVRESAKAFRDQSGKIIYYEGVVEDITNEEYLREQMDAIIRSIPDLIIYMDEDGKYLDIYTSNPDMLALPKELVLGKTIFDIFEKGLADYFYKSIRTSINENRIIVVSYEIDTLGGRKSFEASISPVRITKPGSKRTVVTIARDVTERKKIEIDLVKSNYEKDLFFSIIGYDLREPITSLITTADIFTNYYDRLTPEQIKEYIFQSSEQIYVVKNLIDNLLDWSKSQTGKFDFSPELTDLYNLIENSILVYKNQATNKHISINSSIQPKTYCICDRFMISTVIRNLLSNALKYSYPYSSIDIDLTKDETHYFVSITDHGQGIPEDKIPFLFEDNELYLLGFNKRRIPGLGLHICKNFIERNNGIINVQSKVGEGTTFTFSVPIAKDF